MKKIRIIQLIIIVTLICITVILSSCEKSSLTSLENLKNIQFVIESNARFNAVFGVNDNIIDKYIYAHNFVSGTFSVSNGDILHLSAYSTDTMQKYTFSIIYEYDTLFKSNLPIIITF